MILINLDDTLRWRYGFFSDLLVWCIGLRKVRIFDDPLVQYVHICALKKRQCMGMGRILYTHENDMTCYHLLCNMSASVTRWDRVLYNYMSWLHIWIRSSMIQQLELSIQLISNSNHMRWSRMIFSQSSMCASTFSQHVINDIWLNHYSTFSFSG